VQLGALRKGRDGSNSHRHAGRRKRFAEFGETEKSKTAPLKSKGCGTLHATRFPRCDFPVTTGPADSDSHPPAEGYSRSYESKTAARQLPLTTTLLRSLAINSSRR